MSFLQEFKSFAMRGNAVDMAVGIIIGASFGKIVSSLVNDLLMPPIGLHQYHDRFHDRCLRIVRGHQGDEQVHQTGHTSSGASTGTHDKGMSRVSDDHTDQRQTLRILHEQTVSYAALTGKYGISQ